MRVKPAGQDGTLAVTVQVAVSKMLEKVSVERIVSSSACVARAREIHWTSHSAPAPVAALVGPTWFRNRGAKSSPEVRSPALCVGCDYGTRWMLG